MHRNYSDGFFVPEIVCLDGKRKETFQHTSHMVKSNIHITPFRIDDIDIDRWYRNSLSRRERNKCRTIIDFFNTIGVNCSQETLRFIVSLLDHLQKVVQYASLN